MFYESDVAKDRIIGKRREHPILKTVHIGGVNGREPISIILAGLPCALRAPAFIP